MADNLITRNLTVNIDNVSSVKSNPATPAEKTEVDKKPKQEPVALENVIYTSEDGDTVQVKPEANERLSDGFVFNKTERAPKEETIDIDVTDKAEKTPIREEKENAVKEAEEKATDKVLDNRAALSEISDSELERMYLTGKISSYDYNSAMESRKEEEASENREAAETSRAIGNAAAGLEKNQTLEAAINAQEKGSGYATREENEAVQQAIFGTEKNDNTEGKGFEINIIR